MIGIIKDPYKNKFFKIGKICYITISIEHY